MLLTYSNTLIVADMPPKDAALTGGSELAATTTGRAHYVPASVHKLTIDDAHGRGAMKRRDCGPLCAAVSGA
jgi:hypothetical protein